MARIACVQYDCQIAQPQSNADTVRRLTCTLGRGEVDVVMLPEMALSGYVFRSPDEIQPFLEDPSQGHAASPSYTLAVELAQRLDCYVSIGLPCTASCFSSPGQAWRRGRYDVSPAFEARCAAEEGHGTASVKGAYNSSLLVDKEGVIVHIFRKHFAFDNDKVWSDEGPGFETVNLPDLGRVCVAICMDINPYDFRAPFDRHELARFCRTSKADWLLMNMAWLRAEDVSIDECGDQEDDGMGEAASTHCNYLALRLSPYFESKWEGDHTPQPLRMVTCNRTGFERGTTFAGYSNALYLNDSTLPQLVGCMGHGEGVKVFTL